MIKCSDIAGYCGKTDLQGTGKFGDALYGNSEKYIGVAMQVDSGYCGSFEQVRWNFELFCFYGIWKRISNKSIDRVSEPCKSKSALDLVALEFTFLIFWLLK